MTAIGKAVGALFGGGESAPPPQPSIQPPPPPPPPPAPISVGSTGVQAAGAAVRAAAAGAVAGINQNVATGPQGATAPNTLKKTLGGEV